VSLMSGVFLIVLFLREQVAVGEAVQYAHGHTTNLTAELAEIHKAAFGGSLLPGIFIVYLKGAVCASLTLLLSTFASSMIFTIIVSVVIQIIGHIQPIARDAVINAVGATDLAKSFYTLVALVIPDLSAFSLVDEMITGQVIPFDLFAKTSTLGALY